MQERIPIEDIVADKIGALRGMATTRRALIVQATSEDERQRHEIALADYERRIARGF